MCCKAKSLVTLSDDVTHRKWQQDGKVARKSCVSPGRRSFEILATVAVAKLGTAAGIWSKIASPNDHTQSANVMLMLKSSSADASSFRVLHKELVMETNDGCRVTALELLILNQFSTAWDASVLIHELTDFIPGETSLSATRVLVLTLSVKNATMSSVCPSGTSDLILATAWRIMSCNAERTCWR